MDDLLSRAYCGAQSPKAGLFEDVANVSLGRRQVWLMRTGAHTVREISCLGCNTYIGFQIVHAHEPSERWKDGAYILERQFLFIHSVYECASRDDEPDSDQPSYKWPGTPLRLKVVKDLQKPRQSRRMTVLHETRPVVPVRPLPPLPLSVGAC
ncbi:hypothetical protein EW145_g3095 [Phellinidium pouzarii]|uniref:Yippee domain-containing protein n=1 Tax=Phellinidium pouzarii TaxID=167371 RepID=A0A4S4L8D0_9AGAM|nr:hypothetical protein EW145_g3095 [Phellinidium pouzarii]